MHGDYHKFISTSLSSVSFLEQSSFTVNSILESGNETEILNPRMIGHKISFTGNSAKASRSWENGSFDIVQINGETEKGVKIIPEKMLDVKIIDESTNEEIGELLANSNRQFIAKAVISRDGHAYESLSATITAASLEGIDSNEATIALNENGCIISVSSNLRSTLLGFVNLNVESEGLRGCFSKPISIIGYSLNSLTIIGDDEIADSQRHQYEVIAHLENEESFKVDPEYIVIVDPRFANAVHHRKTDDGTIEIWKDDSLFDFDIQLSASYLDLEYSGEPLVIVKTISTEGGFDTSISGNIVLSIDGSTGIDNAWAGTMKIGIPSDSLTQEYAELDRSIILNKTLDDSFVIAMRDLWIRNPMTIESMKAILITSSGYEYEKSFDVIDGIWIVDDGVPEKASMLKSIDIRLKIRIADYINQ